MSLPLFSKETKQAIVVNTTFLGYRYIYKNKDTRNLADLIRRAFTYGAGERYTH
ncbi:hypothetical protein [Niallia taxi]|uniref:hypothetical protein n=1 Tax=Niallia taxi TaxID=2499688 RepID=UPI00164258C7|nr:hypothetical protein [Niallia taxi]MED3961930.1 hypothetical protein [Niallia taxi]